MTEFGRNPWSAFVWTWGVPRQGAFVREWWRAERRLSGGEHRKRPFVKLAGAGRASAGVGGPALSYNAPAVPDLRSPEMVRLPTISTAELYASCGAEPRAIDVVIWLYVIPL